MAASKTRRIALVSTKIPNFKRKPSGGGSGATPPYVPPVTITDITLSAASFSENAVAGGVIGTLASVAPGATFVLTGAAGGRLALSGNNLVVGATATDYETNPTLTATVEGTLNGTTFSKSFTITVVNVNELTNITLAAATIPENSAAGTVVGALASVITGATFTLTDSASNRFAISGNNLVAGSVSTDFETATTHNVTVLATKGSDTFSKTFAITVTNVNELTDITLAAATIPENSAAGTVVGALASVIAGASFTLTDNASNRFAISGNNLVAGSVATDFETATTHNVTVLATKGTDTFSKTFAITVTNVNELTNITLAAATIPENSTAGTVVGALASVIAGASFTLTDNASNRFAISGINLVAGSVATDFETATTHNVTVLATKGTDTFSKTFTITVTNVNELTNITLANSTLAENSTAGTVVGALASVITGATFSLTDNSSNRFAISGNNLVAGATATNFESATSHDVTVLATKGTDTFSKTFTITITDVDEISDISLSNQTIIENAGQGTPVGQLTSTPSGATFELLDNASNHFQLTGGVFIESGTVSPVLTDISYDISVRGTRLGETFTKSFTITVEADV